MSHDYYETTPTEQVLYHTSYDTYEEAEEVLLEYDEYYTPKEMYIKKVYVK